MSRFHLPYLIGHRGVTETAPENTLVAIRKAAAEGATWVEFDVQLTGDDAPVLLHDDDLNRTTDSTGLLKDMKFDDLRGVDAGSWFDRRFKGEPVPHLRTALELCAKLRLGVNIEIKPGLGDPAKTALACVRAVKGLKNAPRVLLSSFKLDALRAAKKEAPELARGALLHELPENWAEIAGELDVATIHSSYKHITPKQIEAVRRRVPLMLYSVDDVVSARRLWGQGIRAFCTGAPALLKSALAPLASRRGSA